MSAAAPARPTSPGSAHTAPNGAQSSSTRITGRCWGCLLYTSGLQAIDGPYAAIQDIDGFREVATRSRLLGFDGKWAIHPSQIAVCNDVYAPTREQFDRALAMLSSYEHAVTAEGARAVVFEGEMIDEASRKLASLIVGRGRVVGLTESSP